MTHITISVNYKFSIKKFPVKIHEIFLIVASISAIAAKEIALALLKNIQSKILSAYSGPRYPLIRCKVSSVPEQGIHPSGSRYPFF